LPVSECNVGNLSIYATYEFLFIHCS
jgi:hypothetical protein